MKNVRNYSPGAKNQAGCKSRLNQYGGKSYRKINKALQGLN